MSKMHNFFPTEKFRLCKKNGAVVEDIEALFDPDELHIYDTSLDINEGDVFERPIPNGKVEKYEVTQCKYFVGMPEFPPAYDCKIRKLTGLHSPTKSTTTYNITANQVNLANDNAVINAIQYNGLYADELRSIIETIKQELVSLPAEDRVTADECLEVIEAEAQSEKPKKSMINTALTTLKTIKGTIEFSSAVVSLAQFIHLIFG